MRAKLKCVSCGCTEDRACLLPNGDPCAWATRNPPLCTACAGSSALFAEQRPDASGLAALDPTPKGQRRG
jgi:hypothetical protein